MANQTDTAPIRYFLSADRKTQCAVPMSDDLHRVLWGVATYSNKPHDGAEVVTAADPLTWLEGQIAVRCGEDNAALRIGKARADAPGLKVAA